jgi:uncharacterized membrane protein required for colicin V production
MVNIILILIYAGMLLLGWKNGVIKHIASVFATILAIPATMILGPILKPLVAPIFEKLLHMAIEKISAGFFESLPEQVLSVIGSAVDTGIATVAGGLVKIVAFIVALIVLNLVFGSIAKIRDLKLVGLADHLLGLAFSAVSAVLITWIFQTVFITMHITGNEWTEAILTNPIFMKICEFNLFL